MELIFVTNNKNKLSEIQHILNDKYNILSLSDIGFYDDIAETQDTIADNSQQKTQFIYDRYKKNCFGDDTGLMVDALNEAPGVLSARYSGEDATYESNVRKLLEEMQGKQNRNAHFSTVITLFLNDKMYQFEGRVDGTITTVIKGEMNFGYDPVFMPNGYDLTYAQMPNELKNKISHRALALEKMKTFLQNL